jgi:hypothetical protein
MNLPDNILTKMSAADRRKLGVQTSEEAQAAFVAKNEKQLQNAIASLLNLRGIWFCRSRMDRATTQQKGVPDFLLAAGYRPVALEVKFGKGQLSVEQMTTHNAMLRNGWRVHVVRELSEAREILDALDKEHEDSIKF